MRYCSDITADPPRKLPSGSTSEVIHAAPVLEPSQFTAKDQSDRMIALLQEILDEQSNLRQILQENQQAIVPRLDDISASVLAVRTQQQQSSIKVEDELAKEEYHTANIPDQTQDDNVKVDEQSHKLDEIRKQPQPPPRSLVARILLSTYFEISLSLVILINTCTMFVSLQLKGLHAGWKLELRDESIDWATHEARFNFMEHVFNIVYVVELAMRLWVFGRKFPKEIANILDAIIVVWSSLDAYVFQVMNIQFINVSVLRMIRLSRILRLGKVLRSSSFFSELRVLIRTLYIALRGVLWSVLLLSGIVVVGGIIMAQLAINLLDDDSISIERREWMFKYFGTTLASIYTMFESTFTTSWINYSRPLIEEVGYLFAAFWVPWVILVNFTTMRVVSALFLKETMGVSARDAENCAMHQLENKKVLAQYLREIFTNADTSGDGAISQDEFDLMMTNHEVVETFAFMGLDTDEVVAFYTVLAADDGIADYNEFITGALAMATSAPNLDRMKSMQNQMRIQAAVDENTHLSRKICHHFNLSSES